MRGLAAALPALALACSAAAPASGATAAPTSRAADRDMIDIAAGPFIAGSTPEERERAYADARRTSGRDIARRNGWFEREDARHRASLPAFRLDRTAVTQAAYAEFVAAAGEPPPAMSASEWKRLGFVQPYAREVARFQWRDGRPPRGRERHPVVLVTWDQAARYCAWRGRIVGQSRRLPTAAELEKAARGPDGAIYPWGPDFDPARLDSAVDGPRDTVPVGSFPAGASPYGVLDLAGNVFHWSSTPWPHRAGEMTVKGSAWDDHGGVGRGAAQHGRSRRIRHVIIGFRCAAGGRTGATGRSSRRRRAENPRKITGFAPNRPTRVPVR